MDLKGKLKADAAGFLVGQPIDSSVLSAIKADTRSILALMRGQARAASRPGPRPVASPASPAAAATRVAVATPAPRGSVRARDAATGRFMASTSAGAAGARPMVETARAAAAVARTVEAQRRDAKADAAAARAAGQQRGADGRFGSGGRRGGALGALGAMVSGAGAAVNGTEQIDPMLAAIGEARGAINAVRGTVTPIGRAGRALFGSGDAGADQPVGLLRRMWRELRAMRKQDAKADRETVQAIKDSAGRGAAAESRGLFGMLGSVLPALASAIPGLGALTGIVGKLAGVLGMGGGALAAGGKGLLKRLPIIGPLLALGLGAIEDRSIAGDSSLTDAERRERRSANAGGVGGGLAGAAAGAAMGSVLGPVGTVAGGIIGGVAGSEGGKRLGGWISRMFESGRGGAGTISSGKGDFGGKSYGSHQLSSNTGTLQQFLASTGYGAQFAGLTPGSAAFDAKWKSLAADPAFGAAQHDFIKRTHVDPMMRRLAGAGMDLSGRGEAVQEALFSTATQFGPGSSLVQRALAGREVSAMSDADIVAAIQDYKVANNATLFKSSSDAVRAGTMNRALAEKQALLAVAGGTVATPAAAQMAAVSAVPAATAAGAPPVLEPIASTRAGAGSPTVVAAAAPVGQDVADRSIAHIVTGGIGGLTHR